MVSAPFPYVKLPVELGRGPGDRCGLFLEHSQFNPFQQILQIWRNSILIYAYFWKIELDQSFIIWQNMFYFSLPSDTLRNHFLVSLYYDLIANIARISLCIMWHPCHIYYCQARTWSAWSWLCEWEGFLWLVRKVFRGERFLLRSYLLGPDDQTSRMSHCSSQDFAKAKIICNHSRSAKRTVIARMPWHSRTCSFR